MAKDNTWRLKALCRDLDTSIFFPEAEQGGELNALYEKAKAFCRICPVRQECLDAAMREEGKDDHHRYGVRGGTTPTQRKRILMMTRGGHGTYSKYTQGCRCAACTEANKMRNRDYRASKAS